MDSSPPPARFAGIDRLYGQGCERRMIDWHLQALMIGCPFYNRADMRKARCCFWQGRAICDDRCQPQR